MVSAEDSASKKDIMSLLVRARMNEEKAKAVNLSTELSSRDYRMSNEEMVAQVVCMIIFNAWLVF